MENAILENVYHVSPYNALGYGLALIILLFVAFVFYKKWIEERNYNKEIEVKTAQYMNEVTTLLIKVETRLNDQQNYKDVLQKIETKIERINEKF